MATACEGGGIIRSALSLVMVAAIAGCSYAAPAPDPTPTPTDTARVAGTRTSDSFGNVDYYTTVAGDTMATLSAAFKVSAAKIAEFNKLDLTAPLAAGTRLRLIPVNGPMKGAWGSATEDAAGIPLTYTAVAEDGLAGISYRFGLTAEQLDEANMFAAPHPMQERPYLQPGRTIQLQKHAVDPRSGTGKVLSNLAGNPDYYWTVEGDSLDGIGYKVRRTPDQIRSLNPGLAPSAPIPAGTRLRLAPLDLATDGAQGTFTADSQGLPETYTTVPGDTQSGVLERFNLNAGDLFKANPAAHPAPGAPVSYTYLDARSGTLAPGQKLNLDPTHPARS